MGSLLEREVRRVAAAFACLLVAAASGCGPSDVVLPPVPTDIQTVAAVYATPTGTVPVDAAPQIADLQAKLATLADTRLADLVSSTLVALRTRLADQGLASDPAALPQAHRPGIEGSVTVTRTCSGWDDASVTPDPTNGTLQLIAEVEESRLTRIVWGTASACHGRIEVPNDGNVHTYIDGTIAVYLEGQLPGEVNEAAFIMGWNGTLGTEAAQAMGGFDFRVASQAVEVRIAVPDGDIIGSIGADGVTFRGTNGTLACSLETLSCGTIQTARGGAPRP